MLFAGFEDADTLAMHFGTNGSLQHVPRDGDGTAVNPAAVRFRRRQLVLPTSIRAASATCVVTDSAAAFIAEEQLGPDALDPSFDETAFDDGSRRPQAADQGRR